MMLEPTPSEALTSHPPSTTKASDDDRGEEPIDVTPGEKWIARVETARQAVEILGRRLNVADGKFKTLKDFTLEETDNLHKEFEGCQRAEFEMKEAITSLECRLMEALSKIETMKAEMKALKEGAFMARKRRKKSEMGKGLCTINTWEQFRVDFKEAFFLNNVIYEENKELERRQVRTIDEAITQVEALTDFRHEKPDRAEGEEMRGSHDHGGGDRGKVEE
ncbi:hypothetical protein KY290_033425 [Solanum tuberosum]|uniref:Uncharacterized protein n=1 Tax=Solanum tuberosum TaxID=4113 RepID=A0ABQ7U098_SOLTU|nr:hypothetical protein KY290_033425 [Solanum tuberosum]